MNPPSIPQTMQEIKHDLPHLTASDLEYLNSKIRWHLYQEALYGAIKRTKVSQSEEAKAA
jgi:hypothetical protein